ncbi:MAG: phospholipid/glycerol acyltransferase [Planctomycetota bacterium]|nr:phospholipid/glycerol acyltransferase [Planctomycetota bacterium]
MGPQIFGKVRHHDRDPLRMEPPRVSRWLAAILFPLHAVFMKRFFRIEVTGGHAILSSGPFILAPTHRSRWDAFFLYTAVTNRLLYFMVSHDEVVGLQGWLMRRLGGFPITVHRPNPSAIRTFREVIARGDGLVIFPEGNLFYYDPGEVHPLRPGAAWLALQFQKSCPDVDLPIIPVRLVYGDRLLRAKSRVKVQLGEPISARDYAGLPAREATSALTSALQEALGETVKETSSADSLRQAIADRSLGSKI